MRFGIGAAVGVLANIAFSSFGAYAQNAPLVFQSALKPNNLPAIKSSARQDGQGIFNAATDNALNVNSALSSFYIGFVNGDHKIRGIGMMPNNDTANFTLIDNDANDPYHAHASWWNIPGAVGGIANFVGNGIDSEIIPPGPPNSTLVIGGFQAYIEKFTDCDISGFEVGFNGLNNRMRILMKSSCNEKIVRSGTYVWVPNSYITANKIVTGTQRTRDKVSGTLPNSEKYLIRSFGFNFKNGGHHLYSMGISLEPPIATAVHWQDINWDDPIEWRVDYSLLK